MLCMNDLQVPDWVQRYRELSEQLRASTADISRAAAERRAILREAAETMTNTEVARALGVTPQMVHKLLSRDRLSGEKDTA